MANISSQRNALLSLVPDCVPAELGTQAEFQIDDNKAFVIGIATVRSGASTYTVLVLGSTPPNQPVTVGCGTYQVLFLRPVMECELSFRRQCGLAFRGRVQDVRCLEALNHVGGHRFVTTGDVEFYIPVV